MKNLIQIELSKVFSKWRTYIGFLAIGVLVPIVQIAMYYNGEHYNNIVARTLESSFIMSGNLLNGYLIAYFVLNSLFIHIPFLIVLVGGDLLAGEASAGTYRMLLTRPVSRLKILTAKYLTGLIYTALIIFWLAFMSLFVSILIFGTGELVVLQSKILIFASNDVLWRLLLAYCTAFVSMSTVLGLSFLLSEFVENAIGPIVGTMALIIIFMILSAIPIESLSFIKPYLFTNYMSVWNQFFEETIDVALILKDVSVLALHVLGFYLISLILFIRKDILT